MANSWSVLASRILADHTWPVRFLGLQVLVNSRIS